MFFILLLFLFLVPRPVFAAPTVNIVSQPASIVVGDSFPVTFTISGGDTGASYRFKVVGSGGTFATQPNASCDNSYDNCDMVNIADTNPVTATAYSKITQATGTIGLVIRVALNTDHSKVYNSSNVTVATIITPTPSFTPTPTPTATNTPTPTNTPTSTNTPTPTNTFTPTPTGTNTLTPTASPTSTPSNTPTLAPTDTIADLTPSIEPTPSDANPTTTTPNSFNSALAVNDVLPTPTTSSSHSFSILSILPVIFIFFGVVLLALPFILAKIQKKHEKIIK